MTRGRNKPSYNINPLNVEKMNKRDLTSKVAKQTGLTLSNAAKCIDVIFQTIKEDIANGRPTAIRGFGSFLIGNRAERQGINPSTKQSITIPARKTMKFKPSKSIEIK